MATVAVECQSHDAVGNWADVGNVFSHFVVDDYCHACVFTGFGGISREVPMCHCPFFNGGDARVCFLEHHNVDVMLVHPAFKFLAFSCDDSALDVVGSNL